MTGNVSYDPENHDLDDAPARGEGGGDRERHPLLEVDDPDGAATLVLGWGSTYGPIAAAVRRVRHDGHKVAQAHLHYLNPFPRNTGEVLRRYDKILVPEMNLGQLLKLVRAEFLVDAVGYNRVRGCRSRPPSWRRRSRRWWSRDGERAPVLVPVAQGRLRRHLLAQPARDGADRDARDALLEAAPEASEEERQPDGARDGQLQARERAAMSEATAAVIQLTAKDFKSDQEVRCARAAATTRS